MGTTTATTTKINETFTNKNKGRLTFVQVTADQYVDVGKVGLAQHVHRVFGQKHPVHGGRGRESQNARVAVPLFLGYGAGVHGTHARHGADWVGLQRRSVALAVVQQPLRYVRRPFAGHVAPGRVHRTGLYDAPADHALGYRRDEMYAHLERRSEIHVGINGGCPFPLTENIVDDYHLPIRRQPIRRTT